MAVPIGFERWDPGHPWGDVIYDDGTRTSVPDPDGSIEAQAQQYGARFNAMPQVAPDPAPQPALTGAAAPPAQPSTPSPNVPPPAAAAPRVATPGAPGGSAPMPASVPTQPSMPGQPGEPAIQQASGALPSAAPASLPSTQQSPAARAVADQGIDPNALRTPQAAQSPAARAVLAHAPNLLATSGEVSSEGPDQATADNVRAASDAALGLRDQAITENTRAQALNLRDQANLAATDYLRAWPKQLQAQAAEADAQKARDAAAAKLAQVKSQPLDNHPDFPEWFVVTSLLGGIAGGFNQGFTSGQYKSTTPAMLHQLVSDWAENQRYNKSQLLSSLEEQLGDKNAALAAAKSGLHDAIANVADSQARYARTVQASRELSAASKASRATALDEWGKAQTLVMGKESEKAQMGFGIQNEVTQQLLGMGITPDAYAKGLETKVGAGEQAGTLNQAIDKVLQIDADKAALSSLAAASAGTLPGKGGLKIPDALVPLLARMGITAATKQEQVNQLYSEYLVRTAKAMGSRINEGELKISGETLGASTQALLRQLDRVRNETNESIKSAAEQAWPGFGSQVLDLHRRATAAIRGIPQVQAAPFETTNVPEGPPLVETSPEQQRIAADNAASKREADRKRAERGTSGERVTGGMKADRF